MAADTDYDEIVERTVDEVKEAVKDGLDAAEVLVAEKEGRARTTLMEWLEDRVDGTESVDTVALGAGAFQESLRDLAGWKFAAGLVVGVLVSAALVSSGLAGIGGGLSPSAAGDQVETYFSDNSGDIPLEGVEVVSAERLEDSDLYRMEMVLSASFLNRTVEQNQTAIVTSNARYMFLSQPIDTSRPLADQIGTTDQAPQQ